MLLSAATGCATPGRIDAVKLPARHQIRTGRLVIRSDFKLDEGERLALALCSRSG